MKPVRLYGKSRADEGVPFWKATLSLLTYLPRLIRHRVGDWKRMRPASLTVQDRLHVICIPRLLWLMLSEVLEYFSNFAGAA